jgi:hypothetical protein
LPTPSPSSSTGAAAQTGSGLTINVSYDDSVANAPPGFETVVAQVVQYFETTFTDPITINIDVGFGEADDQPLGAGDLGQSLYYVDTVRYPQLRAALLGDATSAADSAATATLPEADPTNGGRFHTTQAEAKALGLSGNFQPVDGYVGFSSGAPFDYDDSDGVAPGQFDFFAAVAHEFSEVMGRDLGVGQTIGGTRNSYFPLDLFHYAAAGERDWSGTEPGYFSTDGGATDLADFNASPGADFGDWAASVGNDAFAARAVPGTRDPLSAADIAVMDAIGWGVDQAQMAAAADSPTADGTASPGDALAAPTQLAQVLAAAGAETAAPVAPTAPSGCGESVSPLVLAAAPHS